MRNQKLVVTAPELFFALVGADGVNGVTSSYTDEKAKNWAARKNENGIKAIETSAAQFNANLAQSAFGPTVRQLQRIDPSAVVETLDEGDEILLAAQNAKTNRIQYVRFMVTGIATRTLTAQPSERRSSALHTAPASYETVQSGGARR